MIFNKSYKSYVYRLSVRPAGRCCLPYWQGLGYFTRTYSIEHKNTAVPKRPSAQRDIT